LENYHNILLIATEFPPQPGGIGNHAFHLASSFQKEGKNITVLTDIRSKEGKEERIFDKNLPFLVERTKRRRLLIRSYLYRIIKAIQLAKKNDVIFFSGKFSLWIGAIISLLSNKKRIAIIHGSEVLLPKMIWKRITDFSLKRFHKVIAVSNYTKSLVSYLKLKNIEVIPNGFHLANFQEEKKKTDSLQLITVGNLTQRKGQHNVLNSIPLLLKTYPKLIYHMVGITTEKEKLQQLVDKLGVDQHIIFHGRVSDEKKIELLQQSHIFTMLSENTRLGDVEGFGIAILEANAIGLPAIGSKDCGIEDAIDDNQTGRLVLHNDSEEFLEAVKTIMGNYSNFSDRAKKWTENFTWQEIIKKYIQLV